jgi:hypothetical protein
LPAWFLVRRLVPGQAGFDGAAASVVADDAGPATSLPSKNAQVFVLSDPAADPASRPAAVALVQPLGDDVAEIRIPPDRPDTVLVRLLVTVLDALRAQGMCRAVARSEGMAEDVASVLEMVGFRNDGKHFALEL